LEEYSDFHRECRADPKCLEHALLWKCSSMDHCLGLGDEVRGLASAFYAAVATKRPFFVVWERNSQDMLSFFEANAIDVSLPEGMDYQRQCPQKVFMDYHDNWEEKFRPRCENAVSAGGGCEVWNTNVRPWAWLGTSSFLGCSPPGIKGIENIYMTGCAFDFMFQLPKLTAADRSLLSGPPPRLLLRGRGKRPLLNPYAAIHVRVGDEDIGKDIGSHHFDDVVKDCLNCAKARGFSNVLFASGSQSAKEIAKKLAADLGISLFESTGKAVHVELNHDAMTQEQVRASFMSEWLALMHADAVIIGGRPSGFSVMAASVHLLPKERIFSSSCSQSSAQSLLP
jgi:hypothetical protein